jgi:hypothetical protein
MLKGGALITPSRRAGRDARHVTRRRGFRAGVVASAVVAAVGMSAATAMAGDPGIRSDEGDPFRLNKYTLEPGCFEKQYVPVGIDLSFLDEGAIATELHLTVRRSAVYNVDQVLVPSKFDGYRVYNQFLRHGDDIAPGETAVELFAPDSNDFDGPDPIDKGDVIVCVSDHEAGQNEPYQQEAGGLVSAKNRPVLTPVISALGVSAVEPLNTYKVGFGYTVGAADWYEIPSFDGFSAFPSVTDPNAVPSPTWAPDLPAFVKLHPRSDDLPYDARRVNDVDSAGEEWKGGGPELDYGQTTLFKREGDRTAWSLSNNNRPDTLAHLITFTAQGDLPIEWTLRPSLAAPGSEKSVSIDDAFLRDWEADWQAFYCGGPKPEMPLAPGTNSPAPNGTCPVVAPPEAAPAAGGAQAPATTVVNNTTVQNITVVSKKKVSAKQRAAYKRCIKKAKAKRSAKARSKAKARCARMPH